MLQRIIDRASRLGLRTLAVVATAAVVITAGSSEPGPALASETIDGMWRVNYSGSSVSPGYCTITVDEGVGTYTAEYSCTGPWFSSGSGTINTGTGAMMGSLTYGSIGVSISGTVSGDSWTGTWNASGLASGTFSGTRQQTTHVATPDPIVVNQGGVLTTSPPDNTTVTIPAHALPVDASISVEISGLPPSPPLPPGQFTVAKAYTFAPAGMNFNPCLSAVFTYTDAEFPPGSDPANLRVYIFNGHTGEWHLEGGVVDTVAKTVTVEICHFSTYSLFGVINPLADTDGDGVTDGDELLAGTDPSSSRPYCAQDYDCDGLPNATPPIHESPSNTSLSLDNCMFEANPVQLNNDGNRIGVPMGLPTDRTRANSDAEGDDCDEDDDNDGLTDLEETSGSACGGKVTDPMNGDTDGDRVLDGAECALGSDPTNASSKPAVVPGGDTDGDGIRDDVEYRGYDTNSAVVDSDGDGCSDTIEVLSVDGNGFITAADLGIVASALGSPGLHANYDVDKNGAVTAGDLGLVASRIGSAPCTVPA